MKKILIFLALILSVNYCYSKQEKYTINRPKPDWVKYKAPIPDNDTYYYKVIKGVGRTELDARNSAIVQAFQQADSFTGTQVNISDIYKALETGKSVEVMSSTFRIPIFIACEYSQLTPDGNWNYWLLCQIAVRGNIVPKFNTQFNDCNSADSSMDNFMKWKKKSNARAIAASTFIPGMGQMLKGQYGAGVGFLLGEVTLFGGGTAFYFMADKQNKVMSEMGVSYDDYTNAKNLKNSYNIAMWCCFGAGAALHIVNMCHAYLCKDKKLTKYLTAFEPVIIPTYRNSQPSYAVGLSWHYDF